jgi:hypothetical protein
MVWCVALLFFQQPAFELPNVDKNPYVTADDVALGK